MKRLLAVLLFALGLISSPSHAQVFVVQSCGTVPTSQATLTPGNAGELFVDTNGRLCLTGVTGNNELRTNFEPNTLFNDTFDSAFNTTTRWTATASGGGVLATLDAGGGGISLGSGTTANGFSYVKSQRSFGPVQPGFVILTWRVKFPATCIANTYAFWGGAGTIPGSPTASAPITDGLGLEQTTGCLFQAVSYVGGSRTLIADLTSKRPTDGAAHTYWLYFGANKFYWSLDDQDNVIASGTGAQGPNINTMNLVIMTIAGSTPPASSLVPDIPAVFVGDNGHNGVGGFDVDIAVTPTVQNAAYSSGNAIGGLQTLDFFRIGGGSGIINNLSVWSKGGSTTAITLYLFNANPAGSTCTDKSAFSLANADIPKLVGAIPPVLTPAVVGVGTTATTASQQLPISVKNGDNTVNLYMCAVVGAVTPTSTTDLVFKISGIQD